MEEKEYHTIQPANQEDPQSVRPDGFPTPAHVTPKYLSKKTAIIILVVIVGIFLGLGAISLF